MELQLWNQSSTSTGSGHLGWGRTMGAAVKKSSKPYKPEEKEPEVLRSWHCFSFTDQGIAKREATWNERGNHLESPSTVESMQSRSDGIIRRLSRKSEV